MSRPASPRPIRWLHLSDLHLGCRGEDLWWQVDDFLTTLNGWLADVHPEAPPPLLVPVPGNHDVARPDVLRADGHPASPTTP